MTRILFVTGALAVAAGGAYWTHPDEFREYAGSAVAGIRWVWAGIEANPVPAALAAGTFLLTVLYHKAKGKSLRESLEVAATRVTVVPVPVEDAGENPVVRRARARATRAQLVADQIGLENRLRRLPEEVSKAEKEAFTTGQAVADTERRLADRRKSHDEALAKLEALRQERAGGAAELGEIEAELRKLDEVV
ncbi:MAG TPA: hypothetical protein VKD90_01410 [Gemmataceae bacterium]|nr:hypothetical protein [Gemmataceae bacterium]